MEMWNGSSWMQLGSAYEAMRCLNANGTFNCAVDMFTEVSSVTQTYFDLNGGPDGLRTQNIEVKKDWWDLFTTSQYPAQAPQWVAQDPYTICRVHDHYHFTAFRGPPSC